jgi:hypothetical protein
MIFLNDGHIVLIVSSYCTPMLETEDTNVLSTNIGYCNPNDLSICIFLVRNSGSNGSNRDNVSIVMVVTSIYCW